MKKLSVVACVLLGFSLPGWTQQIAPQSAPAGGQAACCDALQQQMKALEDRVILLEGQVRMLKEQLAETQGSQAPTAGSAPAATVTGLPAPALGTASAGPLTGAAQASAQLPVYGGASALSKVLNPDISVIGDFLGSAGGNSAPPGASLRPMPALQMHESELGLQAIIDPYARGDFFLSFGEEGVNLEEGYITFTALPAGFVAKAGKMRAAFGTVNTLHNHILPWADRPLVTENLVGGEDGINDAGFSLQRILPAPKGIFLEATGQVFRGDSGDQNHPLFVATQKSDVSVVGHLRGYGDITESTNLDLGVSYARGHNGLGSGSLTQLYGVNATLRWKPLRRSIYHSFVARSEFVWSLRQQAPAGQRSFGFYTSADYQLGRRWFVGGRFDRSNRAVNDALTDHGFSAVLTYWPSEFSQVRGQFRRTRYAEGLEANEMLMQVQFSLGAHGAHPF
jgi:hypothetical protein